MASPPPHEEYLDERQECLLSDTEATSCPLGVGGGSLGPTDLIVNLFAMAGVPTKATPQAA